MRLTVPPPPALPLADILDEALANLKIQGQRSLLALLGIMIGVAAIIAVLQIGHMAQLETLKQFRDLGIDILQVHAQPTGDAPGVLDRRAVDTLPQRVSGVAAATPLAIDTVTAVAGARTAQIGLVGVTPGLTRLVRLTPASGRLFAPSDAGVLATVLGAGAARKLSAPGAPIGPGSRVRFKSYVFTVIGVAAPTPETTMSPTDFDDDALVPLEVGARVLNPPDPVTAMVRVRPGASIKAVTSALTTALAHPGASLEVVSARDLIRSMNSQKAIHTRLLLAVGAISLFVGGIGVMNVMLMSVMERSREIGLRAALGATRADIAWMFLIEAAGLACAGGLAGLVLGVVAAALVAKFSGWTFAIDLLALPLGPVMAVLVGVGFGLHPALRAARLDPIAALRTQ